MDEAVRYDKMIKWQSRLAREIPVIKKYLNPGTVLDLACSSGRHSFALEREGFTCVGVDISEGFISLAEQIKSENGWKSQFFCHDISAVDLREKLDNSGIKYFDNAIILGNAIANLGSLENGMRLLKNIYLMLIPGGRLFMQTVNRPHEPNYSQLKEFKGGILQRIMVPVLDAEYNTELHVNLIREGNYEFKEVKSRFYMYDRDQLQRKLGDIGFEIRELFGSYSGDIASSKGGSDSIWVLEKPEIVFTQETLDLTGLSEGLLRDRLLGVWQDIYMEMSYNCVSRYRLLHPRVLSHWKYTGIKLSGKRILDLGCALGTDLEQMVKDGADPALLTGIEASEKVIDLRGAFFAEKGITFATGDVTEDNYVLNGEKFDLLREEFDIVFAGSLLHLLEDTQVRVLLPKIHSMLSTGGIFFGRLVGIVEGSNTDKGYYTHLYTTKELEELLKITGFEELELKVSDHSVAACEGSYGDLLTVSFYCKKN